MSGVAVEAAQEREIGRYDSGAPELGPTLLVVAGVHGNEPAGVTAAERVLAALRERDLGLKGRLVALRGNLGALAAGRRFLGRDLNRGWSAASIEATRARPRDARDLVGAERRRHGRRRVVLGRVVARELDEHPRPLDEERAAVAGAGDDEFGRSDSAGRVRGGRRANQRDQRARAGVRRAGVTREEFIVHLGEGVAQCKRRVGAFAAAVVGQQAPRQLAGRELGARDAAVPVENADDANVGRPGFETLP